MACPSRRLPHRRRPEHRNVRSVPDDDGRGRADLLLHVPSDRHRRRGAALRGAHRPHSSRRPSPVWCRPDPRRPGPRAGLGDVNINPVGMALALGAAGASRPSSSSSAAASSRSRRKVSVIALFAAGAVAFVLAVLSGEASGLLMPFTDAGIWPWIIAGGIFGAAIPTTAFITGIGIYRPESSGDHDDHRAAGRRGPGCAPARRTTGSDPTGGGAAVIVAAAILQVAPRSADVPPEPEFGPLV